MDHCMLGVTCGKIMKRTEGRTKKWREKWDMRNAEWIKYCRGLGEGMPGESEEEGRTVRE